MSKFNDIDLENWRETDVNTDSLWLIGERTKTGKHKNIYHGNFIPQIPNQLLKRYTKKGEVVFEPFMGSGTTLFECEELGRKYNGLDINPEMIDYVKSQVDLFSNESEYFVELCNAAKESAVSECFDRGLRQLDAKSVSLY
jgi:DNA modification methylase